MRQFIFISFLCSFFALGLCLNFSSCYADSEEKLYGNPNLCDTSVVRYSVEINNILEQNCYSCHQGASPQSGFSFTKYSDLRFYVDDGTLLSSVVYDNVASPMPPDAKMDDCSIEKIKVWLDAGAPEN